MRVGIYATPAVRDRGGIGWYVYYLLRGLLRLNEDFELICYVDRGSLDLNKLDAWAADPRVRWCEIPRWAIRFQAQRDGLDLYHGTNFRLQTVGRYGGVVTIYDGWLDRHPEYSTRVFGQRSAASRTRRAVRRARTSTPLQALNLLNDPTYVEAARFLGQRMILEGGSRPEDRIRHGFRLALARPASDRELAILSAGLQRSLADFRRDPAAATEFLKVGESPARAGLDPAELAAYTTLASTLLNLDGTVTKE